MNILSKLNGWQRLFVLFAVVVYAPLVFFTTKAIVPDNPTAEEVVSALPKDVKTMVDSGALEIHYEMRPLDGRHWEDAGVAAYQYITPSRQALMEYVIIYKKALPHPANYYQVQEKVQETISSVQDKETIKMGFLLAAISLIPLAVLYFIGVMVAWVIRGFRKVD